MKCYRLIFDFFSDVWYSFIVKSENTFTFWKTRTLLHEPCRRELRFPTLFLGVYK